MSDRSTDPFEDLEELFDRMSQQFGSAPGPFGDAGVPMDLREEDDRFVLEADLPGFEADDIDLRVSEAQRVTVSANRDGERETTTEPDAVRYVTRERHHESVSRTVTLPERVDEEATEAAYDAGVLTVSLPKRGADEGGTSIPVN